MAGSGFGSAFASKQVAAKAPAAWLSIRYEVLRQQGNPLLHAAIIIAFCGLRLCHALDQSGASQAWISIASTLHPLREPVAETGKPPKKGSSQRCQPGAC